MPPALFRTGTQHLHVHTFQPCARAWVCVSVCTCWGVKMQKKFLLVSRSSKNIIDSASCTASQAADPNNKREPETLKDTPARARTTSAKEKEAHDAGAETSRRWGRPESHHACVPWAHQFYILSILRTLERWQFEADLLAAV